MKKYLLLSLSIFILNNVSAQGNPQVRTFGDYPQFYFALGIGLDYGGVGMEAQYLFTKNIGAFAGGGYNLLEPSYNIGIQAVLFPEKQFTPTATLMYGYNAVIKMKFAGGGIAPDSKTYFGPTAGIGGDLRTGRNGKDKFSFGIRLPFRSKDFYDTYNRLREEQMLEAKILPVTFSVGYHIGIKNKK